MSRPRISIPVKTVDRILWGDLAALAHAYEIIGEDVRCIEQNYSFAGGHRVRLYRFKKSVHFKVPVGTVLDISEVRAGAEPPRRQQR